MGNSSTKEARPQSRNGNRRSSDNTSSPSDNADSRPQLHGPRSSRHRQDSTFLALGSGSGTPGAEPRKETKQEREARKAKKEQSLRLKERERSLREEGVDGGYLVTLGTYTGPEDFSKTVVRQLMIERRLAPFWRGLNDHSDSWTEHQLVAAARGLPIPAPDEIPPELHPSSSLSPSQSTQASPITFRTQPSGSSSNATSLPTHSANSGNALSSSPFFRNRSKTLASITSKDDSQPDLTPQETHLPSQPQINGQPVEANLYKDVLECPICFLYYPPYLNRTRCCDQPICSECFVQIKRPDPHPPEHTDPNSPVPDEIRRLEEEGQLTSEPACCPFCVQAEFGITYEPPPFRRGLAYSNVPFSRSADAYSASPASHSNETPLAPKRKRGQSVSVQAPGVISTDMVRPDWAEKLASARSQAARRSAAATALHNAAYSMDGPFLRSAFGRRRRQLMFDPQHGGSSERENGGVPGMNLEMLMAALGDPGSSRGRRHGHGEQTSRQSSRADEIEELMMMEAIRQSLAAEEDRRKKEEKEAAKKAKKDQKAAAKDQKAADKAARKAGLYPSSSNASSMFSSPLSTSTTAHSLPSPEEGKGKGKGKASSPDNSASANKLGFNLLNEPTSTLNTEGPSSSHGGTSQSQSETERSIFDAGGRPRQVSAASSSGSSSNAQHASSTQPSGQGANAGAPSVEGTFNFGSLAEMMGTSQGSSADPKGRTRGESDVSTRSDPPQYEEERPNAVTPTQENHAPVMEGRYDSKNYESSRMFDNVSGRQATQ